MTVAGRDRFGCQSLGVALNTKLKASKVLLVGAGGIGCELLKNLVLTGFGEIHVVDLDTIDLSNLNRQFLFGHEHIKRSKAKVAQETASKFNPNVKVEAHHANIKDSQFTLSWFQGFTIAFNALDNLEARRHVNRMCLAANVPLIESGTTGFNGQVQPIKKGVSECYECNAKETPKTFPVCTIRSTPSQPIHCIVWAKSYLFAEIFGVSEDDAPELDVAEDAENAEEIATLKEEAVALKLIRQSMGSEDFPRKIFDKVFREDIERLRGMEDMWKSRRKPEILDFEKVSKDLPDVKEFVDNDQAVWSLQENLAVFIDSIGRLSTRARQSSLTFDKDDKETLDFVAASANLRSHIFDIPVRSEFDIKQMAGNIIPAIATTNAVTAGFSVLQAFKMLQQGEPEAESKLNSQPKTVFLTRSANKAVNSEPLQKPNPECGVCGVQYTRLDVDLEKATMQDLVSDVLKDELRYGDLVVRLDGSILYDQDLDDNLPKRLADMNISDGSLLTIVDEAEDDPRVDLVLSIVQTALAEGSKAVMLPEKVDLISKPKAPLPSANGHTNGADESGSGERKRTAEQAGLEVDGETTVTKKGKLDGASPDAVIEVKDDGAIIIDD